MSYDIYWHRRKETVYDLETGKCDESAYFSDDELKNIADLHSGICGNLETFRKPFEVESTGLNITSNLYRMFSWAVNGDSTIDWKKTLHSIKGEKAEPILRNAIKRMEEEKDEAIKYNSPNGWGTYPNAIAFLKDLLAESVVYSDYYLSINY